MSHVKKRLAGRKRRYRSPHRENQAGATRLRLVASARRLFAQKGYAATSIEAIARDATVAVQTFYATFGSKPALLLALLDTMETEADIPRLTGELQSTNDARQQLRSFIDFGVRLYARAADVLETIRGAGTAEKDLGALWREGESRRRRAQSSLLRDWAKREVLKPGLSVRQAEDIFWALTGPDSYRLFVSECGWSAESYAQWLADTMAVLLLRTQ